MNWCREPLGLQLFPHMGDSTVHFCFVFLRLISRANFPFREWGKMLRVAAQVSSDFNFATHGISSLQLNKSKVVWARFDLQGGTGLAPAFRLI